jgi:hypothetical protein
MLNSAALLEKNVLSASYEPHPDANGQFLQLQSADRLSVPDRCCKGNRLSHRNTATWTDWCTSNRAKWGIQGLRRYYPVG